MFAIEKYNFKIIEYSKIQTTKINKQCNALHKKYTTIKIQIPPTILQHTKHEKIKIKK